MEGIERYGLMVTPHPTAPLYYMLSWTRCQQVGAGVKLRPGLPVSPLFIYHQLPPTTEKSVLPGSLLIWCRGISQLYSPCTKEKLKGVKGLGFCVYRAISWPLKMQLILIANTKWNMMSWAFLPIPNPPPTSKTFILEAFCNTIQSWVLQVLLWETGHQELSRSLLAVLKVLLAFRYNAPWGQPVEWPLGAPLPTTKSSSLSRGPEHEEPRSL